VSGSASVHMRVQTDTSARHTCAFLVFLPDPIAKARSRFFPIACVPAMSDTKLSTIAVIGCGGMIGRATVDLLLEHGYTVLGLDVVPASADDIQTTLSKFTRVVADVTVYDELFALVKQHGCDGVVCLVTPPRNDGNPRSQHVSLSGCLDRG